MLAAAFVSITLFVVRPPAGGADYSVSFRLLNRGPTMDTPDPENGDGVRVGLRYGGECRAYYASVNRRDHRVAIKKRVPDGHSACGSYYALSDDAAYDVPYGEWQSVRVTIQTREDQSVAILVYVDGRLVVRGVDRGQGGPPIYEPGKVLLRADATDAEYDDLRVVSLGAFAPTVPVAMAAPQLLPTDEPPERPSPR